jgi:deazaflavin-dependent oxidoreductase (nitroreductase family)
VTGITLRSGFRLSHPGGPRPTAKNGPALAGRPRVGNVLVTDILAHVPLPTWLARFNRRVTNPLLARAAVRLPYFCVVEHRGRTTGRIYRTPVNIFPTDGGVIIALTYGPHRDWVRNVHAAGGCDVVHRGRRRGMVDPKLVAAAEARSSIPVPVRLALAVLRVNEFLRLDPARRRPSPSR